MVLFDNFRYEFLSCQKELFPLTYLSTQIITENWTSRYANWGVTLAELNIYFSDRVIIE